MKTIDTMSARASREPLRRLPFRLATPILMLASIVHLEAGATIEGTAPLSDRHGTSNKQRYTGINGEVGERPPEPAVVWLEGDFSTQTASTNQPVSMPQKEFQFAKSVLAIQVGTEVSFPNRDPDYHNVFSYSKPKRFDLGRYRKDETAPTVKFDKPGVIRLYCEIHEHMRATVLVLDSPHFTTSDAQGRFRLENLPEGSYTLKAWIGRKTLERPVQLKDGQTLKVDFTGK